LWQAIGDDVIEVRDRFALAAASDEQREEH
jgi:hypothetical protein